MFCAPLGSKPTTYCGWSKVFAYVPTPHCPLELKPKLRR